MDELVLYLTPNPHRPADWRWRLAKCLIDRGLTVGRSRGDRHVALARRFAQELDGARTEIQQLVLAERQPEMFNAWYLYQTTNMRNARWELEARVLAKEPLEAITKKIGFSTQTIETYTSFFFDVKDKATGYILHNVLGDAAKRIMSEREPELLWKMYGYFVGPQMLDLLIYRFDPQQKPGPDTPISALLRDDVRGQLQLKSAIAMRSLQVNGQTQTEILNLYMRMLEMEKQTGEGGGDQEALRAGIQGVLENLPWTRSAAEAARRGLVSPLESGGVGLRSDELLLIGAGQEPKGLRALMESAVYPPRVRKTTASN